MLKQNMPNPNEQLNPTNRAARYDAATDLLAKRIQDFQQSLNFIPKYNMVDMVVKFRTAFKNPDLRKKVLLDKYETQRVEDDNFSAGFCGMASYAWAHIFRMPNGSPMWHIYKYSNQTETYGLKNHVWLQSTIDNSILDLTFDQSQDSAGRYLEIPYHLGTRVSEHFAFKRGFVFGDFIDVDLRKIALQNALRDARE